MVNGEHDAGEDMIDWPATVRSQFMERKKCAGSIGVESTNGDDVHGARD